MNVQKLYGFKIEYIDSKIYRLTELEFDHEEVIPYSGKFIHMSHDAIKVLEKRGFKSIGIIDLPRGCIIATKRSK